MKQGTVKFSKEFVTPIGLKEWVSCEMEYDMSSENPKDVLTTAKNVINEWYASNNHTIQQMVPITELPIINKADERIELLIENSSTLAELMHYKSNNYNDRLQKLWENKYNQLNK